jgi:hypothetical protein
METSPTTEKVKNPAKHVKKPVTLASDAECQTSWPCPGIQQPRMVEFMSGFEVSGNAWSHMSFSGVQTASKATETDHIQSKTVGTCTGSVLKLRARPQYLSFGENPGLKYVYLVLTLDC